MPVLGAATLELNADSAKLEADFGRGVASATAFGATLGVVLGAAITSAARHMGALVSRSIDAADAADKASQKFGVTTEWFTQTAAAADLANVSVSAFSTALKQLANNAQHTSGPAAAAFRAMGIDARKFGNDTQGLFDAVMLKLASYEDGANKVALANAVMGRSGTELIPMANELEKNRSLAEKLGITLDKQTAAGAAAFKDNMKAAELGVGTIGTKISAELLPTMEKLSEVLVETAKNGERLALVSKGIALSLDGLILVGETLVVVYSDFAFVFKTIGGAIGVTAAQLAALARLDFKGVKLLGENWKKDAALARVELDAFQAKVLGLAPPVQLLTRDIHEFDESLLKLKAPAAGARDAIEGMNSSITSQVMLMQSLREGSEKQAAQLRLLAEDYGKMERGLLSFEEENLQHVAHLKSNFGTLGENVKESTKQADAFNFTFNSALEDAIINGENLSTVVKALEKDIARMVLRQTVTTPLSNAVSGGVNDVMRNLFSGNSNYGDNPEFGGARAGGGSVSAGRAYLVGEEGPELMVPDSAGTIVPNGGMGGLKIVNTYNVSGNGVTEAQVRHIVMVGQRQTLAAVEERSKR